MGMLLSLPYLAFHTGTYSPALVSKRNLYRYLYFCFCHSNCNRLHRVLNMHNPV